MNPTFLLAWTSVMMLFAGALIVLGLVRGQVFLIIVGVIFFVVQGLKWRLLARRDGS